MLDTAIGQALITGVLAARHEQLVGEQRMHRLATEARAAGRTGRPVSRTRRVAARYTIHTLDRAPLQEIADRWRLRAGEESG